MPMRHCQVNENSIKMAIAIAEDFHLIKNL